MMYAGRINQGDLQYEFDDAVEDTNSNIIPELKSIFVISQLDIKMIFTIYGLSLIPLVVIQLLKLYK